MQVTGNTAAADVTVENVNVDIRSFGTPVLDFTNFDVDGLVTINRTNGFATAVTITQGGDFEYQFGAGVLTATLTNYDEGLINTGELTTLTLGAGTEANLNVEAGTVALTKPGVMIDINANIASGATLDIQGTDPITGDIVITGSGTIRGDQAVFAGAEIAAENATLRIDAGVGTTDLEDINVATIAVGTTDAQTFTTAEGKTFNLVTDAASITADTSDEGGTFTVNVNNDATASIVVAAVNADAANVNIFGTAVRNDIVSLTAGATTNINVSGASYTITTLTEAAVTNIVNLTGAQSLTITNLDLTNLNAGGYTGNVTVTANTNTTTSNVTLGSGNDRISAVDADASQTYIMGGGNDTVVLDAWRGATGQGLYIDLGAGDDIIDLNEALAAGVANSSIVIVGGSGFDTIDLDAGGPTDFSVANLTLSEVELITINNRNYTFGAATLDGQTGLTIQGTAAPLETVTIVTGATDRSLDLSGVTFTNVDTSTITLSVSDTTAAFTGTLTNMADTVAGLATTNGFTLDLGAGNDTITLAVSGGTAGSGGTLKLGAGSDTVVMASNSTKVATGQLVNITDFNNSVDVLDVVSNAVGATVLAGAAVDVSAATSSTTDSFSAYVTGGKIILVGDDAANVDTLAEWVAVAGILAGAAPGAAAAGAYMFEFGGNTYVTDQTLAGVEVATIELTGITGLSLGLGGGASVITIS